MRKVEHGVTQAVTNAVTIPNSTKSTARLTVYKSRVYFETYTNNAPAYARAVGSTSLPVSEAVDYNTDISKIITLAINNSGNLSLLVEDTATEVIPTYLGNAIAVDPKQRPGIYQNILFFYQTDQWKYALLDPTLLDAGTAACITGIASYSSLPTGAIYPLSEYASVIIYLDDGGIRVTYVDADYDLHTSPGRFINPTYSLLNSVDADLYVTHYGGAINKDGIIYIYLSCYNGSVKVIKYKLADNYKDGSWSDILIAVPEDLSTFKIGNIFTDGTRVFMCGQFYRNEEYDTGIKYTLLLWSDDGITFSMDRRTLVTPIDLRFFAVPCELYISYISTNRFHKELASYQYLGELAENTVVSLNEVNGSAQGGWSVNAVAGNEMYVDNTDLQVGNFAKLELGINTTSGTEWVKYHDVVISRIGKGWRNGARMFNIQIMPDGLWHTSSMTHPFYMEIQGKQAHFDPMSDMHNMFKMDSGAGPSWALSCDFWTDDVSGGGLGYLTHGINEQDDHWSKDFTSFCDTYPVIGNNATLTFRIYGWSRSGKPSLNPNVSDDTPSDADNDTIQGLLLLVDSTGNESTVVIDTTLTSTYNNFPQTYIQTRSGSNPIIYSLTNVYEGYKIKKVGARVISNTGTTCYYLSRVEIPEITMHLSPLTTDEDVTAIQPVQNSSLITKMYPVQIGSGSLEVDVTGPDNRAILVIYSTDVPENRWVNQPTITCTNKTGWDDIRQDWSDSRYNEYLTWSCGWAVFEHINVGKSTITFNISNDDGEGDNGTTRWYIITLANLKAYYQEHLTEPSGELLYFTHFHKWGENTTFNYNDECTTSSGSWDHTKDLQMIIAPQLYSLTNNDNMINNGQLYFEDDGLKIWTPNNGKDGWDNTWLTTVSCDTDVHLYGMPSGTHWENHPVAYGLQFYANEVFVPGTQAAISGYNMINVKKGSPQIFFSSRPFTAWNFDATLKCSFKGIYCLVGAIGLASNNDNFVTGYIRDGHYGIAKIRGGARTILIEQDNVNIQQDTEYDIRFWHRDGLLGFEIKDIFTPVWPTRGSQIVYEWTAADEGMCTTDDIKHVGFYQHIDPPRFRTTGFRTSQTIVPVLPLDLDPNDGDSDFENDFPASGQIDIEGLKYTYSNKLIFSTSEPFPVGPTQLRNFYKWISPFNKDRSTGYTYQGGTAIEFTEFRWLTGNSGNANMYAGAIIASSAGYSWINDQTQWKSWITTGGAVVWLRERSRHYSDTIPDYTASCNEKIYITNGLTGIIAVTPPENETTYPEGTYVYLDSDDEIMSTNFYAVNGEPDYSIAALLDKFCRIAGTKAIFPGDIFLANPGLDYGETLELS